MLVFLGVTEWKRTGAPLSEGSQEGNKFSLFKENLGQARQCHLLKNQTSSLDYWVLHSASVSQLNLGQFKQLWVTIGVVPELISCPSYQLTQNKCTSTPLSTH